MKKEYVKVEFNFVMVSHEDSIVTSLNHQNSGYGDEVWFS